MTVKRIFLQTFLLLCVSLFSFEIKAQVDRVEPPNWWCGMKSPDLQLMLHGTDLAGSEVTLNYPGVKIRRITSGDGPNYLFIDLYLSADVEPGTFELLLQKKGKKIRVPYELKARVPGSANREGFNNSDVIYLLVPDRFANGNPRNDNAQGFPDPADRQDSDGRHGGDLKGIMDHAAYLNEMGFTALWPTPVLENKMNRTSYHGYAITDFYRLDPRIGTNEEYAELSRILNEKGIKLIQDMVFNHCGSEHWWMNDLPFRDWINYYPEMKITNHRRTVNEDPHASQYDRTLMTDGWFVSAMPDLNQKNPYMATYLIQNSIWWIEFAGLSGIRMDTWPYPDKYMMANWTKRILDEYPDFNMVGEEWSLTPVIVSYWQKDHYNRDGYASFLPSLMDFPLQSALFKALTEREDWGTGWITLYEMLAQDFMYPHPDNLVVLTDNHDMPRFFNQLETDTALYNLGITWLLTTRGIPQIYYGSEILMSHAGSTRHGDIRADFPGGWDGDAVNAFTGKDLSPERKKEQLFFKTLLNWRKANPVVQSGKLIHFAPENGCYVYFRYNEQKRVMVVLNKNRESVKLKTDRFVEMLHGYQTGTDVITGTVYSLSDEITVPSLTPLVLELK
ncbi:MAG: glycoside hydrolase family 13 protein [Bacteroidota bacterium]